MEHLKIEIHGIVQGVGFRPFMHREIRERGLSGTIRNSSSGVVLELEGERAALEAFLEALPHRAPKLAVIDGGSDDPLRGLSRSLPRDRGGTQPVL